MKKRNFIALCIFAVFYISFGILLTFNQDAIIYRPTAQDFHSCPTLESAQKVTYQDTRMYVHDTNKPVVVHYHGNAESACDSAFYAKLFERAGYGYIIVEYTGYSNDPKKTTHERIKKNARAVVAYLESENIPTAAIVGQSIGTGVAAYHTSLTPPEKLLLIAPFTTLADVARNQFWFYPTSLLVDNAFDSVSNLNSYAGSVMIIHGTNDTIIPYRLGVALHQSLTADATLVSVKGARHNDLFLYPKTITAIDDFLAW